jgi:hypothetical protein
MLYNRLYNLSLWAGKSVVLPQWAITKQGAFMKNIKLLAIIAIVAVFGFAFTACGPDEEEIANTIIVTGITGNYFGKFGYIRLTDNTNTVATSLPKQITGTSLSMDLYETDDKPFSGSGTFELSFVIITDQTNLQSDIYTVFDPSKSITTGTTSISMVDLTPIVVTYVITGTAPSFKATKDGTDLTTTGAIQAVVNAVRADAAGKTITIQFGNGTNTLEVGTIPNIEFDNTGGTWGLITFKGKISGATAGTTVTPNATFLLHIRKDVWAISNADITNTDHIAIRKTDDGTLTITGGTIIGNSSYTGVSVYGDTATTTVNILGGTISGGYGAGCAALMNIQGGTITGTTSAVVINNNVDILNISGGTITGTGNGRGILIADGTVTLSGNPTITSATIAPDRATIQLGETATAMHNNNTALTIGANVIITNTGTGGKLVLNSNTTNPWKIKDDRVDPPGGNLTN